MLVRSNRFVVNIPEGATRVIAHTRPGESIFVVKPSVTDASTIGAVKQHSLVVTESGYWVRFNSYRNLLSNKVNSVRSIKFVYVSLPKKVHSLRIVARSEMRSSGEMFLEDWTIKR
jgi:hypothetical protein